jgi:hypothetical protein
MQVENVNSRLGHGVIVLRPGRLLSPHSNCCLAGYDGVDVCTASAVGLPPIGLAADLRAAVLVRAALGSASPFLAKGACRVLSGLRRQRAGLVRGSSRGTFAPLSGAPVVLLALLNQVLQIVGNGQGVGHDSARAGWMLDWSAL